MVPGAVVLDHVLKLCEGWQRRAALVRQLRQVKFHSPLLPADLAEVSMELAGDVLTFRVARGDRLIAQGTLILAAGAES